jgi:hypothetical protein
MNLGFGELPAGQGFDLAIFTPEPSDRLERPGSAGLLSAQAGRRISGPGPGCGLGVGARDAQLGNRPFSAAGPRE